MPETESQLTFKKLWGSHPRSNESASDDYPCDMHDDQCAIRVGVALTACGVDTKKLRVTHCGKHPGHTLRAQELAEALSKAIIPNLGKVQKFKPTEFKAKLRGLKGIIFFEDYWARSNQQYTESFRNRSGDHIDLWNGANITSQLAEVRLNQNLGNPESEEYPGIWTGYQDSRSVWFWRVP